MTVSGQVSAVRIDRRRGTKERKMKEVIWTLAAYLTVLGMAAPEHWIWYAVAVGGVLLVIGTAVAVPRQRQ